MTDRIQAERERLCSMLEQAAGSKYAQTYAASIALAWVLDPERFEPPSAYITRIPEGSPDCLASSRPAPLPEIVARTLGAAGRQQKRPTRQL